MRGRWNRFVCGVRGHRPVLYIEHPIRTTSNPSTIVVEPCTRCGALDASILRLIG